jgi:ketosteroid isomerase-like protein
MDGDIINVLDRFCASFAVRDVAGVMRVFAPDGDVALVTSEEMVLHGHSELRDFLEAYARGPTIYSWSWDVVRVGTAGAVAWLLAEGIETATQSDGELRHPYRMTMVCEQRAAGWMLMLAHGSSPHHR